MTMQSRWHAIKVAVRQLRPVITMLITMLLPLFSPIAQADANLLLTEPSDLECRK